MLPQGDTLCQKSIKAQKMKCLIFLIFHSKGIETIYSFLVFAWEDQIRDEAKTNLYLVLTEGFPYTILNANHIALLKNEFHCPLWLFCFLSKTQTPKYLYWISLSIKWNDLRLIYLCNSIPLHPRRIFKYLLPFMLHR